MFRYLVEKKTGEVLIRTMGTLGISDASAQVIIEAQETFVPGESLYDFKKESFVKKSRRTLSSAQTSAKKLRQDQAEAAEKFGRLWEKQDPAIQDLIHGLLTLPNDLLMPIMKKAMEKRIRREGAGKKKAVKKKTTSRKKKTGE